MASTKTCTGCGETKSLADFYRNRSSPDGRCARCKDCMRAYAAGWYRRNRDKVRLQVMAHRAANREHYNRYMRDYRRRKKAQQG